MGIFVEFYLYMRFISPSICHRIVRQIILPAMTLFILLPSGGCKSHSSVQKGSSTPPSSSRPVDRTVSVNECLKETDDPMARALISEAQQWIGTRYRYGGQTKDGTDCSGLVMSLYKDVCGVKIPRTTTEQVRYCTKVARNKIRPGDLVFFGGRTDDDVSHVGLYIGHGQMVHASSSRGVIVSGFDSGYWGERYFTGARVDGAPVSYAAIHGGNAVPTRKEAPIQADGNHPGANENYTVRFDQVGTLLATHSGISKNPVQSDTEGKSAAGSPAAVSSHGKTAVGADTPVPSAAGDEGKMIDILDQMINEKVDSIFADQFHD